MADVDPTDPNPAEAPNSVGETSAGETTDPATAVPEADAAEQHTDVRPLHDEAPRIDRDRATEADAVEQSRVVALDEDDYR
ncbi:hypothetical protein [Streptomyces sp. NPDC058953]|uniref:hypothetical protein n=1 Tax=unclassified Streptomyces TaxID=2593676 RepID=UPI00368E5143